MAASGFMRIVLIAASVLIIIGVVLVCGIMLTDDDRNNITVNMKDIATGESKTIEFEKLGLVPGGQCEYTVKLKGENSKKYDLKLDFVDMDETGEMTLKNYARVRILSGEEIICDELLADAFKNDVIVLPVDFNQGKNTDIVIVHYLPIDVGNETKKAEAVFDLVLTASNE